MAVPTQPSSASTNSAATRGGEGKGIRERSSVLGKGKGQHTEQKRTKKQQQTTLQSVCAPPIPSTSSVRAFLRVLLRPIPGPAALLSPSFLPCLRSAGESSASEGSAKAGDSERRQQQQLVQQRSRRHIPQHHHPHHPDVVESASEPPVDVSVSPCSLSRALSVHRVCQPLNPCVCLCTDLTRQQHQQQRHCLCVHGVSVFLRRA